MEIPCNVPYLDALALTGPHLYIYICIRSNFLTVLSQHPDNIMDLLFRGSAELRRAGVQAELGLAHLCIGGHITWFILSIRRSGSILRASVLCAAKMTD